MRQKKGFTLLELLVVIAIIVLLLSLLAVLIKGMLEKSRNTKTAALIKMLDEGCSRYKVECGVFPPQGTYSDSRCLHYYLGKDLKVPTGWDSVKGSPSAWKTLPPPVQFKADMLDLPSGQDSLDPVACAPVPVLDAWGKVLRYKEYPGQHNASSVDIWSLGKDDSIADDDITNWGKEF